MLIHQSCELSTIGVDVSKETLNIYVFPQGEHYCIDNNSKAIRQLLPKLPNPRSVKLVALEATNRFEKRIRDILFSKGYRVNVAHPSKVHYFGRSLKGFCKTDKADAAMIAQYANQNHLKPMEAPDPDLELLEEWSARRTQLMKNHNAESSRLSGNIDEKLKRSCRRMLKHIHAEIALIDVEMDAIISSREELAKRKELLLSCKSIGETTAIALVGCLPELGNLTRSQISALVGVAPYNDDSGGKRGARKIRGGRAHIRSLLFMCSLSAVRHNPPLRDYYKKLRENGKLKKVALIAIVRKLIITLNAMLRDGKPWNARYDGA